MDRLRIFQIFKFWFFFFSSTILFLSFFFSYILLSAVRKNWAILSTLCLQISSTKYPMPLLMSSPFPRTLRHEHSSVRFPATLWQGSLFLLFSLTYSSFLPETSSKWPSPSLFHQHSVHDYWGILWENRTFSTALLWGPTRITFKSPFPIIWTSMPLTTLLPLLFTQFQSCFSMFRYF